MTQQRKLSSCCISHEFSKAATKNPNKIAVVHACGGAKLIREFRRRCNPGAATAVSDIDYDKFFGAVAPSSHPPVYEGDRCFTFAEILAAVDSLSTRLRRILDGEDNPDIVRPTAIGTVQREQPVHAGSSEVSMPAASGLEQSNKDQNMYTPKIIGIYIVPSVEYIIAVLSVLRCGEAFMPLNPLWPKERISSILASSNTNLIIRCQSYFDGRGCYEPDKSQKLVDGSSCPELWISIKGNLQQQYDSLSLSWPCENVKSRLFCYLMYTSGSTGKPKGVCGTEIGLLNRFLWMQELYPLIGDELLLFKTSISFIDHLQEVLGALLSASTLIIPPLNEIEENRFYVYDFLQAYSINRLIAVPSLIRVVLPALQSPYSSRVQNSLNLIVLSGEVFPLSLWELLYEFLPKTTILNLYGSTEVSGDCSYFDCKRLPLILESEALSCVPIGLPISNCDLVLANEGSPIEGEIYVGGFGTATGYYYDLSIRSEDFVMLPQGSYRCSVREFDSQYYFKTGDFARRLQSGDLVFLGRKDRLVKVNGQRIALEEIEGTLRGYQGVVDAVVIYRSGQEVALLEAYIIMSQEVVCYKDVKYSIRCWMLGKLPLVMIPNNFFFIKSFPMSSTGKVDYALLASLIFPVIHEPKASDNNQSTECLQVIKKAFSDALLVEMVSDDDDFFAMGGNSISAAHVSHNLGIDMRLLYIFPSPLRLHMALLEKKGPSSIDDITPANNETLVLPYDSKIPNLYTCKSSRRFSRTLCNKSYGNPKAINLGDGYPWDSDSICMTCSISRCNKVFYERAHEENNLCLSTLCVDIPREIRGIMRELWKVNMESCVDASPLVVLKDQDILLFIGSHSYKFSCIDAKSGSIRWEIKLEGRIECSAAILDNFAQVVVGCYQGNIYFLDFFNGNICWSFQTGGEVKSQPVVDRCRHMVWCGSHDHNLYGLDYISYCCVYKFPCGGSVFGSPVIDEIQNALYVASTSGRVTAISVKALPFSNLWLCELKAPIFGSLTINIQSGTVICCLVDGHVVALNSKGSIVWKVKTSGPIFAGPCVSDALTSQVLICSRDGSIYSFGMEKGILLWKYNLGDPITSSAYIDENMELVSKELDSDPRLGSDRLICVCSSSGSIYLLRVPSEFSEQKNWLGEDGVHEFARVDLQGDIFSSPVMIGGRIFVGCRDDYVHCLRLEC